MIEVSSAESDRRLSFSADQTLIMNGSTGMIEFSEAGHDIHPPAGLRTGPIATAGAT